MGRQPKSLAQSLRLPEEPEYMEVTPAALGKRIRYYRLKCGMNQPQLAAALKVPANNMTNWETGVSRPSCDLIPRLCMILGITTDVLFGMPPRDNSLTAKEWEHMELYRSLPESGRSSVDTLMESMVSNRLAELRKYCRDHMLRREHNLLSASAGFGNPLDTTYEKEYMFLHATPAAKECDEIITACGDSMEPYIHNGDDLLVEHTSELEPGEVGIFVADGEGLVKQYQTDGLYSFNRKYPPRRFFDDDNVRCVGRVLGVVTDDMRATEEESAILEKLYSEKRR